MGVLYLLTRAKSSDESPSTLAMDIWSSGNVAGVKGQLGVPLTVYPWYLLCSLGILGDYNP